MRIIDQSAIVLDPLCMSEGIRALKLCERAGRTCYNSFDKTTDDSYERFLRNVIKRGHTSVLEHGKVTLEVVTGRDVLAEITRHRICSFSVQSQRYVQADKNSGIAFIKPHYYVPPEGNLIDAKMYVASRAWEEDMKYVEKAYARNIEEYGLTPEDARKVLTNSAATQFVMTTNFRELLHIIELRTSVRAYPEMRIMMDCIIDALKRVIPPIWEWERENE